MPERNMTFSTEPGTHVDSVASQSKRQRLYEPHIAPVSFIPQETQTLGKASDRDVRLSRSSVPSRRRCPR